MTSAEQLGLEAVIETMPQSGLQVVRFEGGSNEGLTQSLFDEPRKETTSKLLNGNAVITIENDDLLEYPPAARSFFSQSKYIPGKLSPLDRRKPLIWHRDLEKRFTDVFLVLHCPRYSSGSSEAVQTHVGPSSYVIESMVQALQRLQAESAQKRPSGLVSMWREPRRGASKEYYLKKLRRFEGKARICSATGRHFSDELFDTMLICMLELYKQHTGNDYLVDDHFVRLGKWFNQVLEEPGHFFRKITESVGAGVYRQRWAPGSVLIFSNDHMMHSREVLSSESPHELLRFYL